MGIKDFNRCNNYTLTISHSIVNTQKSLHTDLLQLQLLYLDLLMIEIVSLQLHAFNPPINNCICCKGTLKLSRN